MNGVFSSHTLNIIYLLFTNKVHKFSTLIVFFFLIKNNNNKSIVSEAAL